MTSHLCPSVNAGRGVGSRGGGRRGTVDAPPSVYHTTLPSATIRLSCRTYRTSSSRTSLITLAYDHEGRDQYGPHDVGECASNRLARGDLLLGWDLHFKWNPSATALPSRGEAQNKKGPSSRKVVPTLPDLATSRRIRRTTGIRPRPMSSSKPGRTNGTMMPLVS